MPAGQASSGLAGMVRSGIGFVLLMLAQFGIRPLVAGRVDVDFAFIAIFFLAVRMRPGIAAVTGFLVGIALDSMAPATFGTQALSLTLIAYGASWIKAVFFADHVGLVGFFIFAGKWIFDITHSLLAGVSSGIPLVIALLVWSPLSAAITALVAVLLLVVLRPLYRSQSF